jgi:hypothetical protein
MVMYAFLYPADPGVVIFAFDEPSAYRSLSHPGVAPCDIRRTRSATSRCGTGSPVMVRRQAARPTFIPVSDRSLQIAAVARSLSTALSLLAALALADEAADAGRRSTRSSTWSWSSRSSSRWPC